MSKTIRVIVVDDQRLVREGIATLLSLEPDIDIVGRAVDGKEAVALATDLVPDLMLMDVRMPVMTGIEATIEIRKRLPNCQILMLTTFNDDEYVVQSLKAGACGYLLKDIPSEDLAQAIRLAHTGIYQLFPAGISLAEKSMTVTGRITSFLLVGGSLGSMSIPWLIGQLFEPIGPQSALWIITGVMCGALVLLVVLLRQIKLT